ncbi:hypothetical protein ScalyP_jg6661 [Parmales sp. scaly parma]|nr:hypothetical protein ScalyP_jg6661 [Parmales sp. scaly parma]
MTYSAPIYMDQHLSPPPNHNYKLFEYKDARMGDRSPSTKLCIHHPVVFLPGHWGSHEQGRSVASHGYDLSGMHATPNPNSNSPPPPYYTTFVLDFDSEASVFSSEIIDLQSEFLISSISHILNTKASCLTNSPFETVTIVAHSMGGIVATNMFTLPTFLAQLPSSPVKTIITLSTPHVRSPVSLDKSMSLLYDKIDEFWSSTSPTSPTSTVALLSFSGGRRDELVAPELCETSFRSGATLLVSDVADEPSSTTFFSVAPLLKGLDHRSIVWCRNLLIKLRPVILESFNVGGNVDGRKRLEILMLQLPRIGDSSPLRFRARLAAEDDSLERSMNKFEHFAYKCVSNSGQFVERVVHVWIVLAMLYYFSGSHFSSTVVCTVVPLWWCKETPIIAHSILVLATKCLHIVFVEGGSWLRGRGIGTRSGSGSNAAMFSCTRAVELSVVMGWWQGGERKWIWRILLCFLFLGALCDDSKAKAMLGLQVGLIPLIIGGSVRPLLAYYFATCDWGDYLPKLAHETENMSAAVFLVFVLGVWWGEFATLEHGSAWRIESLVVWFFLLVFMKKLLTHTKTSTILKKEE